VLDAAVRRLVTDWLLDAVFHARCFRRW